MRRLYSLDMCQVSRWANTFLDCCSSANLDWGVKLPTSWGQGVYMTCARSAVCGLKPNGHTICYLLSKNHGPACHHEDNHSSCFQFRTGSEGRGIPHRVQLAHQVIVIRRTWFRSMRSHLIVHLQDDESIEVMPFVKGMREIWMKNIIQIIFFSSSCMTEDGSH